jgi:hypothetical protein
MLHMNALLTSKLEMLLEWWMGRSDSGGARFL